MKKSTRGTIEKNGKSCRYVFNKIIVKYSKKEGSLRTANIAARGNIYRLFDVRYIVCAGISTDKQGWSCSSDKADDNLAHEAETWLEHFREWLSELALVVNAISRLEINQEWRTGISSSSDGQ